LSFFLTAWYGYDDGFNAFLGLHEARFVFCVWVQDQLDNADGGREEMEWLPESLPPHVRIVVSTLPVVGGCWPALQRKRIVGICPLPASEDVDVHPGINVAVVQALDPEECAGIVSTWLRNDKRTLTAAQMSVLNTAVLQCPFPLYIKLAYDRTRRWRSFHDPEVCCVVGFVRHVGDETMVFGIVVRQEFEPSIDGLIHRFFADLEKFHGRRLVGHAVGYMCASDGGTCAFDRQPPVLAPSRQWRRLVGDGNR
jgi:hypothetical protein